MLAEYGCTRHYVSMKATEASHLSRRVGGHCHFSPLTFLTLLTLIGLPACASNGGPTVPEPPAVSREWVTGAAAAALGPDGRFVFPAPAPRSYAITEAEARKQAVAWARAVSAGPDGALPGFRFLERDHGGPIPFAKLTDCGRALYAQSAYKPLPDTLPQPMLNAFGSYWVVRLCSPDGEIPIVVAVAETSELSVGDGQLKLPPFPAQIGNEFRSAAVPRGTPRTRAFPLEPEAAVAFAYRQTGRRISEVPEFWQRVAEQRPDPISVHSGHWRLRLEAPVHGVGAATGTDYNVRDVVVFWPGFLPNDTTLQVAVQTQPDTALHLPYPKVNSTVYENRSEQDLVRIEVRVPYIFEILTVQR